MITIDVDKAQLETVIRKELRKKLNELEHRHTFWDMKELCKQTCMSEPFIKQQFFYDPRFPKYRVGRKWLFPAKAAEEFLLEWLQDQKE